MLDVVSWDQARWTTLLFKTLNGGAARWHCPNVEGVFADTYRELHKALICLTLMRRQQADFGREIASSKEAIHETLLLLKRLQEEGF